VTSPELVRRLSRRVPECHPARSPPPYHVDSVTHYDNRSGTGACVHTLPHMDKAAPRIIIVRSLDATAMLHQCKRHKFVHTLHVRECSAKVCVNLIALMRMHNRSAHVHVMCTCKCDCAAAKVSLALDPGACP
jgi:hypothetical protein